MIGPSVKLRLADAGARAELDARAAAAMEALAGELEGWLAEEVARLADASRAWDRAPGPGTAGALRGCAHDLKGLGATCGFPLAGRIAGSLEQLLEAPGALRPAPLHALVAAHVAAVRAVVREGARQPDHPLGARLAQALEAAAGARPG